MLLKLFGALAVGVFAARLTVHAMRLFSERILQLEGFLKLLRHIREKISCFRTPTPEIFKSFENDALSRAGFLPALAEGDMSAALRASRTHLYLDEEEMGALLDFSAALGGGFCEEEVARCDLAIAAISEALTRRRETQPRASKLCRTLVLGASLAVIIVLI